jgi:transposase
MFEQVHRLVAAGWSVAAIARELKLTKLTVRKYRDMETFRDGRTLVRVSDVEPYRAYLEQRWAEGCTEAKQLWLELQAQGYRGSYRRVWSFTRYWQLPALLALPSTPPAPSAPARTPRQGMWLLMLPAKKLTEEDEAFRVQMCERSEEVAAAYGLVQAFRKVLQEGEVGQLDDWLERAKASGVRELRRFALGLENDAAAVRAALEHEWSNGQVEGQVTRLKLLKRQMYGRAKLDLLRARVLHRA